ncbi:MAG: alpha/beta hydrolase [Natronomonas sp.]|uniref:alpha/beta hydrolase n=1 Tax=Natronomonas sp. TaxID=2184060 RepID=UPI0028705F93|nr:alpha/beta hydrolase [Natronomonas sp.]MDR9382204.1 alpha/beta hydrolase [Natronomonas sp.]MDR9429211.1 alpha/beta hydrolase [Natronomonas sp.]
MADEPHPQLTRILELTADAPNFEDVGVAEAREAFEAMASFSPTFEVHEQYDTTVAGADGDLDARVYRPGEGDRPVLAFFHGGGFVIGGLDTHDNVCQRLATESGWTVVSVDYRLAPEHPFPTPLEDAYAAVESIADDPEPFGGDGTVAVGGDSAGGNLATGVTLLARDAAALDDAAPDIDHQLLYYPACGSPFESYGSREENAEGYFLERSTISWFDEQYVHSPTHARNEYLAPLLVEDLSELPDATIVTAGFDPLRDEGIAYAEALEADGVAVEHCHYESMIHGFVNFIGRVDAAEDAISVGAAALDRR